MSDVLSMVTMILMSLWLSAGLFAFYLLWCAVSALEESAAAQQKTADILAEIAGKLGEDTRVTKQE